MHRISILLAAIRLCPCSRWKSSRDVCQTRSCAVHASQSPVANAVIARSTLVRRVAHRDDPTVGLRCERFCTPNSVGSFSLSINSIQIHSLRIRLACPTNYRGRSVPGPNSSAFSCRICSMIAGKSACVIVRLGGRGRGNFVNSESTSISSRASFEICS